MEKKTDNRLTCSDSKRMAIKATRLATAEKRKGQVCKVYEFKIVEKRLNKKQHEELDMLFVEGKWFYNQVLSIHQSGVSLKDINSTTIKSVEHFDKDKNKRNSELKYIGSQEKQAIISRMISNEKTILALVKKGLQKFGNLRFKSELNCIPLKQYKTTYSFKSKNKVKIQGISGNILVRGVRQLSDDIEFANADLIKRADGYFLKVVTFTNKANFREEKNGKEIGLDFGIKTNITTSEGEKLDVCVEESERLKKLQRKLFKQVKGSNNRYKTIKKLRREYQKLSNKKQDKANKIIHQLKQYETIVIQDEQIANWHQEKSMSKKVQHSCLGLIKAKLKQLSQTIVLDKFIPTTKWCPKCRTINQFITLQDRTYHCGCGHQEDRDVHAAKNMLTIKDLILTEISVPLEQREFTLVEFREAVEARNSRDRSGL